MPCILTTTDIILKAVKVPNSINVSSSQVEMKAVDIKRNKMRVSIVILDLIKKSLHNGHFQLGLEQEKNRYCCYC